MSLPSHIPTSSAAYSPTSLSQPPFTSQTQPHKPQQPSDYQAAHISHPIYDSHSVFHDPSQYMPEGAYFPNPAIRLHRSTPNPPVHTTTISHANELATSPHAGGWTGFDHGDASFTTAPSLSTPAYARGGTSQHQRAHSSSSIASSASESSYRYSQPAYSVGQPECSPPLSGAKFESYSPTATRVFSNNLPTPTQTPTQDSFASRGYPTFTPHSRGTEHSMAPQMALKQDMFDNGTGVEEDLPGFSHSARQSVSSFANSPSTPHTVHEDVDDRFKVPTNDLVRQPLNPFDRTMSDDVFGNTATHMPPSHPRMQRSQKGFLSPYNKNQQLAELLQEASRNRSMSPSGMGARSISPFRQGSKFMMDQAGLSSAAQLRQRQKLEADAFAASSQVMSKAPESQPPKTISPKDVELEYHDTDDNSKMPLFPDEGEYSQTAFARGDQYGNATQNRFDNASGGNFGGMATPRTQGWISGLQQSAPAPPQSSFNFTPVTHAGDVHGLQFTDQPYQSGGALTGAEPTPDFPAHLTSMESSASETGMESHTIPPTSSGDIKRPDSTLADGGTYSCTYHGCAHRFDTPQKLQRHKREAHRHPLPGQRAPSPAIGSNMSSAALLARNSQAGPHKCERINPTTNKPCNVVFSRPYDLTRHEDTIHNARKQKVRCALCVEEKTFSRSDALTRHMRVVHPEVDFPGKHRRRGAQE